MVGIDLRPYVKNAMLKYGGFILTEDATLFVHTFSKKFMMTTFNGAIYSEYETPKKLRLTVKSVETSLRTLTRGGLCEYSIMEGTRVHLKYKRMKEEMDRPKLKTSFEFTPIWNYLRRRKRTVKMSKSDAAYIIGILDYVVSELLTICVNYIISKGSGRLINEYDIMNAVNDDPDFIYTFNKLKF